MLELLGFGQDISKVRTQLLENLEIVKDPNFIDDILEKLKGRLKEREDLMEEFFSDAAESFLTAIAASVLAMGITLWGYKLLKEIAQQPFVINRVHCWLIEFLYNLENEGNGPEIDYLMKLMQRKHQSFLRGAMQLLKENGENAGVEHYFQFLKEELQDDPNYDRIFAYTLRQTTAIQMPQLLKEKQAIYQGDYLRFLEIVLIDFNSIIPAKSLKVAKRWLKKERKAILALENGQKMADLLKEKAAAFQPLPGDYVQIKGRLDPIQLRRFFSFLHLEHNGSLDDQPFLLKEEVEELLQYGLSYPLKEPKDKRFSLRLNSHKTLNIIYYAMYQLYIRHRPTICAKEYKRHFAYFLKHHFDNFDIPIDSIWNSIRSTKPKRMRKNFDLEDYFD